MLAAFNISAGILIILLLVLFYARYTCTRGRVAALLVCLALAIGVTIVLLGKNQMKVTTVYVAHSENALPERLRSDMSEGNQLIVFSISRALLILFLVPFIVRLFQKWIGGKRTEQEQASGAAGFRAWILSGNLVCCVFIPLFAWLGFGYSFWGLLALTMGLVLAYPVSIMIISGDESPRYDDISDEREKVLSLLEQGKITPEESSALLNALGETMRATSSSRPLTPEKKLLLAGALLVVIGFALPWFNVNMNREMSRLIGQMGDVQRTAPTLDWSAAKNVRLAVENKFNIPSISFSGAHVESGLGWLTLILAIGAAGIPFLDFGLKAKGQWQTSMIMIGIGVIVLLFVLTRSFRFARVGIFIVLFGYFLEMAGIAKQMRTSRS